MQKILTAAEMREVDRLTTEKYGIPSILLMENAAHAVARVITAKLGGTVKGKSVLILCGPGNNGGDGAALARLLGIDGAFVDIVFFGKIKETKGDARTNFGILCSGDFEFDDVYSGVFCELHEIQSKEEWNAFQLHHWNSLDVIVDAIFGTGLARPLETWLYNVVHEINLRPDNPGQKHPLRVAVDIPAGLNSDTGDQLDIAFQSDITVTFTAPKAGNVLPGASGFNGHLVVADIGSPAELVESQASQLFRAEVEDVREWLEATKFKNSSYKNKRGHALIIAGSKNYTGAAVLCGEAAIRSGAGLVTVAAPEGSRRIDSSRVSPEVMVRGLSETKAGSADEPAAEEIAGFLENIDVVAVGSGLSSKEEETRRFVSRIVDERKTPVVIDADGLTALSPWKINGSAELPLILTPHEGEFLRLIGTKDKQAVKNRVAVVREFATEFNVILVLKGERPLVGGPDGTVVVNPTGSSGLGKAGNGDTLTGLIAGFVAQAVQLDVDIFETVVAAVYFGGFAGDLAEAKYGKRAMTASDVRDSFREAFGALSGADKARTVPGDTSSSHL